MAIGQRQESYAVEVDAVLQLVLSIVQDAKAGKAPLALALDAAPKMGVLLTSLSEIGAELKANKAVVEKTVLDGLVDVANAALSSASPVPPAPAS